MNTHPLNSLDLPINLNHVAAYELVVLLQVHLQQVVMDQPQCYVTCKLARSHSQLRNLAGCDRVQVFSGVQVCAKVRVVLRRHTGCFKNYSQIYKVGIS